MNVKRIICLICILAVISIPTIFHVLGIQTEGMLERKRISVLRSLESDELLGSVEKGGICTFNTYSSLPDEFRDAATERKVYRFFEGKAVLRSMKDYNVYRSADSKVNSKSTDEIIALAEKYLTAAYGDDFKNYSFEETKFDNYKQIYTVTFSRCVKGFKIDNDKMYADLTIDGELAAFDAPHRNEYDGFTISDAKEVYAAKNELIAEAEARWQCPVEVRDFYLMYGENGQKMAALTVLFEVPGGEGFKNTDWLTKVIS